MINRPLWTEGSTPSSGRYAIKCQEVQRRGAADIYYIPIGKNEIRQVFPLRKNRIKSLEFRINLLDYLKAYGVQVQPVSYSSKNTFLKPVEQTIKEVCHQFALDIEDK